MNLALPRLARIAITILVATAAGCSTSDKQSQRSVPSVTTAQPQWAPSSRPAVSDAGEYIRQSASIALFSIRAAEAALQRASNRDIRTMAQRILKDQTGLSSQLSFAGRRLNLLPSARLLPRHDKMLRELVSSPTFDRTYLTQQRAVATSAYRLHRDYLSAGTSATLRPVARNALAVTTSELEQLRRL